MSTQTAFYKNITTNTAYLIIWTIFANAAMFFSNILMARSFSPADYGTITLIISINAAFVLISDMGISTAITKLIPENITNPCNLNKLISDALKLAVLLSAIATAVLLFSSASLTNTFIHRDMKILLDISSVWIICYLFLRIINGIFSGFQQMAYTLITTVLFDGLRFVALCIAIYAGFGINGVIIGWTLAKIAAILSITFVFMTFLRQKNVKLQRRSDYKLPIMKYGLYFTMPFLGGYLTPYLLNVMTGWFSTSQSVALLSISLSLSSITFLFSQPIATILLPVTSEAFAADNLQRISPLAKVAIKYICLLSFGILCLLVFFENRIIILIYGEKYSAAGLPLIIMAIAAFFESSKAVTTPLLNGTKYAKTVAIIEILKFAIILGVGTMLIYIKGPIGAAAALASAYLVSSTLKIYQVKKVLGIDLIKPVIEFIPLIIALIIFILLKLPAWIFAIIAISYVIYRKLFEIREIYAVLQLFVTVNKCKNSTGSSHQNS